MFCDLHKRHKERGYTVWRDPRAARTEVRYRRAKNVPSRGLTQTERVVSGRTCLRQMFV